MANKLISRENVHANLGVIMIVCLTLTIVTFFLALIWIGSATLDRTFHPRRSQ